MFVKVAKSLDMGRLAVWDNSPEHLEFEVWKYWNGAYIIADGKDTVYEVADTNGITQAIQRGSLVEVNGPANYTHRFVEAKPEVFEPVKETKKKE